jgi:hypothetical protein
MKRAVQMVLRFIAAGLILVGGLNVVLEFARHGRGSAAINLWACLLWTALVALGVALFARAPVLASQMTDDFDDE